MASIRTPQEILELAKICQPLAANDVSNNIFLNGGSLDTKLAIKIYMERKGIQWIYDRDPVNAVLRNYTNYLFRFLSRYVAQADIIISDNAGAPPIVSGPENQTLNISGTASFSIVIEANPLPVLSIAWYKNNVLVPGETGTTYSYAATVANNGDTIRALVTNAKGATSSVTATLTVTANISGFFWFGDDDPYPDLAAGIDNLTYQTTFAITTGQPLSIDFPDAASNNRYNVTKYPLPQGLKTTWYNTPFNNGTIPDAVFQTIVTIGQFYYIVSREAMSLDPAQNLVFS